MGYGSYIPSPGQAIVGHDLSLFGGPIAHWSGNGTLVETITGGAGYDLSQTSPGYVAVNPLYPGSIRFMETKERSPGVPSMNASLKLTGDTTVAGWFCITDVTIAAFVQLFSAMKSGTLTSNNNAFWGIRVQSSTLRFTGFWQSGARVDQAVTSTTVVERYRWYHVVFTRGNGSSRARIYVNGLLEAQQTGLAAHTDGSSVTAITTGHDEAGANTHIGLFSVSLYNQELTPAEVKELYESSII